MRTLVVDAGDVGLLTRAYEDVLVGSFTPDELIDLPSLVADVEAGVSEVVLAVAADGASGGDVAIEAVGVWDRAPGAPVGLLAYLAARPGLRSRGAGGALLSALLDRWRAPGGPAAVFGEVHDPARWPTSDDERPVDRLRFYARYGARVLDVPWVQPRVAPGLDRVAGMLLLALTAGEPVLVRTADGSEGLDGDVVRAWMAEQIARAEGPEGLDDPQFGPSLAAADRPVVPLGPIDLPR